MKKLLIIGSSGFVGKSLNDYIKNKIKKKIKVINYSRSNNKNLKDIKKLPKTDCIIYCIRNKNIRSSLKFFFSF